MRIQLVMWSCVAVGCTGDLSDEAEELDEIEQHAEVVPQMWQGAGPHPCGAAAPVTVLPPTTFVGEATPDSKKGLVHDDYAVNLAVAARVCVTVTSSPPPQSLTGDVWSVLVNGQPVWSYAMCHPMAFGATPAPGCAFVADKGNLQLALQLPAGVHTLDVWARDRVALRKVAVVAQGPTMTDVTPMKARAGQIVTIRGEGFTSTPGALRIGIGGRAFEVVSVSGGEDVVKVRVPKQPVVGKLSLSNALGEVLSGEAFDAPNWACKAPFENAAYEQPAADSIAFDSLIEAAGYASAADSDWVDAAAGNLCGGGDKELLMLKNRGWFFSVLGGPTPRFIKGANLSSDPFSPWRTVAVGNLIASAPGVADYDEFVALRKTADGGAVDIVLGAANATSCEPKILTSRVLGGEFNSSWIDAAIGDFDGDGKKEIALLRNGLPNVMIVKVQNGALVQGISIGLDAASTAPWKAIAAGNIDGVSGDEIVVARNASDNAASTVIALKQFDDRLLPVAASTFGNNGNSKWTDATIGDFNGDGRSSIVLVKNEHSNFAILELLPGVGLTVTSTHDLDSTSGQPWRGLTAVDWSPRGDRGAHELVAVRAAGASHHVDVFVYGNSFHRKPRDSALVKLKGQEFGWVTDHDGASSNEWLRRQLVDSGTTTYAWYIRDSYDPDGYETTGDYQHLTEFLEDYANDPAKYCVGDQQLRIWVGLRLYSNGCSPSQNSTITDGWNENAEFPNGGGYPDCLDYRSWAKVINRLAQRYPQIVALTMDDMTHSLYTNSPQPCPTPRPGDGWDDGSCHARIIEDDIANLSADLRRDAFWLSFAPTFYTRWGDSLTKNAFRDLGKAIDSIVMFFRNEVVGRCDDSCHIDDIDACPGQCLAGGCAELTTPNAACELRGLQESVPAGRPIQLGIYATSHGCGPQHEVPLASTPTPRYAYDLARLALANPAFGFGGAMMYEAPTPTQPLVNGEWSYCEGTLAIPDPYCAIRRAFRGVPSSPFDPATVTCP